MNWFNFRDRKGKFKKEPAGYIDSGSEDTSSTPTAPPVDREPPDSEPKLLEQEGVIEGEYRELPREHLRRSLKEDIAKLGSPFRKSAKEILAEAQRLEGRAQRIEKETQRLKARARAYRSSTPSASLKSFPRSGIGLGLEPDLGLDYRDAVEREDRKLSMKDQLRVALQRATTGESAVAVLEHFIARLMKGGRTRATAEKVIARYLDELHEEGDILDDEL